MERTDSGWEDADFVYVALEKCTWTLASLVDPSVTGGGVDGTPTRNHRGDSEEDREDERTTTPWPLTAAPVPLEAFKLVAGGTSTSLSSPTQLSLNSTLFDHREPGTRWGTFHFTEFPHTVKPQLDTV